MSSKLSFSREGMSSRNNFYPKSHTLSNLLIMTSVENFVCGQLCQELHVDVEDILFAAIAIQQYQ